MKINNTNNNNQSNQKNSGGFGNRFKFDPDLYKEPMNNFNSKKASATEKERGYSNLRNNEQNTSTATVNLKSTN